MPTQENLECVVKRRGTGLKSQPYRVAGDPEDTKAMQALLAQLAKGWRDLNATHRWMPEYEMTVKRVDKPWMPEIYIPGLMPKD
jgi:hypothetical protein